MRLTNLALTLLTIALLPQPAHASALDAAALAAEIERLGKLAAHPDLGESGDRLRSIHQDAAEALQDGRPHWALERLRTGLVAASAYHYMLEHRQVTDLEAFDELWSGQSRIVEQAGPPSCSEAPSQVRALVEVAANRAVGHYHAARAITRSNDSTAGGFYYLGQALAEVALARLCEVFRSAEAAARPGLPAPLEELAVLEDETGTAYAVPGAALERHSDFIALNATLKELGELGEAGARFGAFDRFLDATLRLAGLEAPAPDPPVETAELRRRLDRLAAVLKADSGDHSIAFAYLEQAQAALEDPEAQGAQLITDRVLPVYLERVGLAHP